MLNFSLRGTKTKVVVELLHVVACTNGRGGGGGWDEQPASRAQWIKKMKKKILLDIFKNFINLITKCFFSSNQYFISSALFAVELSLTTKSSLKIYEK